MDAKITKKRLGIMLSYDWIKIIAICAAIVVFWVLIFTMTATKPTIGQEFGIYAYPGIEFSAEKTGNLKKMREEGALSYDILEYSMNSYGGRSDANTVLSAHIPAGTADIVFTNDTDLYDENNALKQSSGYKVFTKSFRSYCVWMGDVGAQVGGYTYRSNYFKDCENYLKRFYGEDFENGALNKEAAESNFRTRMKKDKRFKNETQIREGLEQEYERLENLRDSYVRLQALFADGTIGVRTIEVGTGETGEDGKEIMEKWTYALDLSNVPNITYLLSNTEKDGTNADICMSIIHSGSSGEEDRRYEPISYLIYLVDLCQENIQADA